MFIFYSHQSEMLTKQLNFLHTLQNIREKLGLTIPKVEYWIFSSFSYFAKHKRGAPRTNPKVEYIYIGVTIILFYLTTCFIKLTRGETCSVMTSLVHVWLTTSNAEFQTSGSADCSIMTSQTHVWQATNNAGISNFRIS